MKYPMITMTFEAFHLLRLEKSAVYSAVDIKLGSYSGFENISVVDMNLIPESMSGESVTYRVEILQVENK